jgi:hypothetical protein
LNRAAIVTLALGEGWTARWRRLCEENWRSYAARHGYDLILIDEPLDSSERAAGRSPAWQKLLILEQPFAERYERIVWTDSDLLFGADAPAVTDGVPPEKVGAVDELWAPSRALRDHIHGIPMDRYYGAAGLEGSFDQIVQTGLLVLSPAHHRDLLRKVYDRHEDPGPNLDYEMRPLSFELLDRDLVWWLDPRFNRLWTLFKAERYPFLLEHPFHPRAPEAVDQALDELYGLHFAGAMEEMDALLSMESREKPAPRRARPGPSGTRAPVVLLMFARPDTTAKVLDAIREARPRRLLVVADGPREDVPGEAELCERTRALLERVDWDCEVSTDFSDRNLGQKVRVESGLSWAFGLEEEAIVLEDDTLPHPSFFRFCDELLERYRDDERVLSIAGNNFQFDGPASADSYYFSRYSHIWGWACWRRSWELDDPEMSRWPELRETGWLEELIDTPHAAAYWAHQFDLTRRDRHTWDFAWLFACWLHGGLHAVPNVNLVSNLGFREDATHTGPENAAFLGELPTREMQFPLSHPAEVERNVAADDFSERVLYSGVIGKLFDRLRATRGQDRITT